MSDDGPFPNGWEPKSDPQRQALVCPAEILLFGGAAGSLKSETLLIDAALERQNSRLRSVLFRRSYPELEKGLIRRSRELYAEMGGRYNEQKKIWKFPSGASVEFAYCESEKDVYRYQGAEYSFIAFDESTHFTEFPLRYMLSRLRSTEPSLRLRMRLATNPGNVGHNFHKAIFHGPVCTHCRLTSQSRRPGEIYSDALWPSDQRPLRKTTCFIRGSVLDHSLLGESYQESLASLPGAFRKALLDGCWDVYEGQYFDIWDPTRMVVKRQLIGEQPSWPHWIGADYGFQGSQAAAYLFCKSPAEPAFPAGRIFVLEEYAARHQKAAAFAQALSERFERRELGGGAVRRVVNCFLSPDAWSQRGDDHSLAEQMRAAAHLPLQPASTDRVGGAMLIYSQLDSGELLIADTCRQLLETLPSRIHNPDRPDDILKVVGDPLDDCLDALRYGLYSFIAPPRLSHPAPPTAREPTVAMLQRRLAEERWRQQSQPSRYISSRRRH